MKRFAGLILLLLPLTGLTQTDTPKKKSFFLELAGSGGFGSVNFEKDVRIKKNIIYSSRIGFCFIPIDRNNGNALIFPYLFNARVGKNAHKLEVGIGQGVTLTTRGSFFVLGLAAIGYRFEPLEKKIFFKIGYTPLISYIFDRQIEHWGGIGIGYTFKSK